MNMRDFLVYLAGPIAGLTYGEGQDWRNYVSTRLPVEIRGISPLRAKAQQLARVGKITGTNESCPLTSQSGLTARDRFDCTRADAVIMNLLGATKVSIGTMIEVGWADLARKPLILVMEKEGNVHDHPMVRQCAGFRVDNLDAAISVCTAVLMPEGYGTPKAFDAIETELLRPLDVQWDIQDD
jgi:nucleoside 2-deoxyribosyltransferase